MAVYLVEETYELLDAIESDNAEDVCEELGDVLFHILFLTRMFEEAGRFRYRSGGGAASPEKWFDGIPMCSATESADSAEEVKLKWRDIKQKEKQPCPPDVPSRLDPSQFSGPDEGLPDFGKGGRIGFDWDDLEGVKEKAEEEMERFQTRN